MDAEQQHGWEARDLRIDCAETFSVDDGARILQNSPLDEHAGKKASKIDEWRRQDPRQRPPNPAHPRPPLPRY